MTSSTTAGSPSLHLLYWYTIVGAGGFGLLALALPGTFVALLGLPAQDPFVLGVAGALWLASGVVAAIGLRDPARFAPIFLVQAGYKTSWLLAVFLPGLARGDAPPFYAWLLAAVFVTYVALDVVVIRNERLLAVRPARSSPAAAA